jgi:hypothetical protein
MTRTRAPLRRFAASESGAVTTDWIVLTGAIVGLGLGAMLQIRVGVAALAMSTERSLSLAEITALGTVNSDEQILSIAAAGMNRWYYRSCHRYAGPMCRVEDQSFELSDGSAYHVTRNFNHDQSSVHVVWRDSNNQQIRNLDDLPEALRAYSNTSTPAPGRGG